MSSGNVCNLICPSLEIRIPSSTVTAGRVDAVAIYINQKQDDWKGEAYFSVNGSVIAWKGDIEIFPNPDEAFVLLKEINNSIH